MAEHFDEAAESSPGALWGLLLREILSKRSLVLRAVAFYCCQATVTIIWQTEALDSCNLICPATGAGEILREDEERGAARMDSKCGTSILTSVTGISLHSVVR